MTFFRSGAGLIPSFPSPAKHTDAGDVVTEEAAVQMPAGPLLHVTPLVSEGDLVRKGAAVACLRNAPGVCLVAPIAGRVARVNLSTRRTLSEIVLYRMADGDAERHETGATLDAPALRHLFQKSGIWPFIRRRPFGGMPASGEVPAGIVVMAVDTRPDAPNPVRALEGREDAFEMGLHALSRLTEGELFVCWPRGASAFSGAPTGGRVRMIHCGPRHPQGSAGIRIHRDIPASIDAPVWDIHAEDVAEIGALLQTGVLQQNRMVRIAGAGLRETRTVRTHPGADLRQLTHGIAAPGPHELISGSALDGRRAHWLGQRDRQVTVLPQAAPERRPHWVRAALMESRGAKAIVPTAALTQAFGASLPAAPMVRALGAGDEEAAIRLGLLSLLEEDIALADYVAGASGDLMAQLRSILDRVQTEYAA